MYTISFAGIRNDIIVCVFKQTGNHHQYLIRDGCTPICWSNLNAGPFSVGVKYPCARTLCEAILVYVEDKPQKHHYDIKNLLDFILLSEV